MTERSDSAKATERSGGGTWTEAKFEDIQAGDDIKVVQTLKDGSSITVEGKVTRRGAAASGFSAWLAVGDAGYVYYAPVLVREQNFYVQAKTWGDVWSTLEPGDVVEVGGAYDYDRAGKAATITYVGDVDVRGALVMVNFDSEDTALLRRASNIAADRPVFKITKYQRKEA